MHSHVYINSLDRTNKDAPSSRVSITLNTAIKAKCAELSFFSMPNTWYNVTSANNQFYLNENLITIPQGCYDLQQLLTQVQSLLPPGSAVLYNDVLNLINITLVTAASLDFSVGNCHILLGYKPELYPVATSHISFKPPKIYSSVLLVKTNLASNMVSNKGYHSSFIVPVNVNKSELLQFYNRSQFSIRPKVNQNDIYSIDIVLYDEYENELVGCGDFTAIIAVYERDPAEKFK